MIHFSIKNNTALEKKSLYGIDCSGGFLVESQVVRILAISHFPFFSNYIKVLIS